MSNLDCHYCGESISYREEIVEMLVGKIVASTFEVSLKNNGLEYMPRYYHKACWMEQYLQVRAAATQGPYILEDAICPCSGCGNGISPNEVIAQFRQGMLKSSSYYPNGDMSERFTAKPNTVGSHIFCMTCVDVGSDNHTGNNTTNNEKSA